MNLDPMSPPFQTCIYWFYHFILKPNALDICRHISAAVGDTQIQFVNHSVVKFVCVRIPSVSTWVRRWYLHRKIWISHWPIPPIPNVQPPSHIQSLRQSLCGRVGKHHMACGDWFVCQTTSVCNNPITIMYGSNSGLCISCVRTCMLRWNSDGHIELGTVWAVDPRPCSLARWTAFCAFGNTLCGMSCRDQHKTASPHAVNALMTNVWL